MHRTNPQMNGQTGWKRGLPLCTWMCIQEHGRIWKKITHFRKAGGISGRSGYSSPAFDFLRGMYQVSLEVQWLRIRLLVQGTRVLSLVWKESTRPGAAKPGHHDY